MGLIKNYDGVLIVNFVVLSDFFVYKVVVGHEDDIGGTCSISGSVVRAKLVSISDLVHLLNVYGFPGHQIDRLRFILEVDAWVETLL